LSFALFRRVKWPEHKADHSPQSSAEIKMSGSIPPLLQYAFLAWCLIHISTLNLRVTEFVVYQ